MSKRIVVALVVLVAAVVLIQYLRIVHAGGVLEDAAKELLANWHPRYEPSVRTSLATRAAALGLRIVPGTVRLGRVPTTRDTLASIAAHGRAQNYEVSIEAGYVGELVGIDIERKLEVRRVVTTDGPREEPRRPAGPLPIFVD